MQLIASQLCNGDPFKLERTNFYSILNLITFIILITEIATQCAKRKKNQQAKNYDVKNINVQFKTHTHTHKNHVKRAYYTIIAF